MSTLEKCSICKKFKICSIHNALDPKCKFDIRLKIKMIRKKKGGYKNYHLSKRILKED